MIEKININPPETLEAKNPKSGTESFDPDKRIEPAKAAEVHEFTNEEQNLLNRLSKGELDGVVGDSVFTEGKSEIWSEIRNGTPVIYKEGPTQKFFNGKENERIPGIKHTLATWETDIEKLSFLQKYGWLIDDVEANAYSAKFKPEKSND